MTLPFRNRTDAGNRLGSALAVLRERDDLLVLGLPRGGIPVAAGVAAALQAPLDAYVVRKLGVPWQPELAMGAIATGGVEVINEEVVQRAGIDRRTIDAVAGREWRELARREERYRANRPAPDIRDRTVILVDDGLATGTTMAAAIAAVRQASPRAVIVAVPVAPPSAIRMLRPQADRVFALYAPTQFDALGAWYADFRQTTDAEVQRLLAGGTPGSNPPAVTL